VDPEQRVLNLPDGGWLSRGAERVAQANGRAGAGQGHRLDELTSVCQKVHGSILVSVAGVPLNGRIYP
jgi:hypothetical protein